MISGLSSQAERFAQRLFGSTTRTLATNLQRLGSGLRINRAADDAAGLAIATHLETRIRGAQVANRNITDARSLVETRDGILGIVINQVQRIREIAVQAANDTNQIADKQALQTEVSQLLAEIDRIATTAAFHHIELFPNIDGTLDVGADAGFDTSAPDTHVQALTSLFTSALSQSEQRILEQYGLQGDGATLEFVIDDPGAPGGVIASISFTVDVDGKAINQHFNIDLADFDPSDAEYDRIVAHEMVHAIMGRTMNFNSLRTWFQEGTAEFIHGADTRLYNDLSNAIGSAVTGATIAAAADALVAAAPADNAWVSDSAHYSTGYAAVRYLHANIKAVSGSSDGLREVMDYLSQHQADTLDDAIQALHALGRTSFTTLADLENQFNSRNAAHFQGGGAAFIETSLFPGLLNEDTGAIGGSDADGGDVLSATGVVPDVANLTGDPLSGFTEALPAGWTFVSESPVGTLPGRDLTLQIGAAVQDQVRLTLKDARTAHLGIAALDVSQDASQAIKEVDRVLAFLSRERAAMGAYLNRLESMTAANEDTIVNTSSSRSRIIDLDYAQEVTLLTKTQIVQQASQAALVQARSLHRQTILQLLQV